MSRERKNDMIILDRLIREASCNNSCTTTVTLEQLKKIKNDFTSTAAIDAVREIIKIIHSQKCYDDGSGYLVIDKSDLIYDIKTRWRELKDGT